MNDNIQPSEIIRGSGISGLANMVQNILTQINPETNASVLRMDDYNFFHRYKNEYLPEGTKYAFVDNALKRLMNYVKYIPEYNTVNSQIQEDYLNHINNQTYDNHDAFNDVKKEVFFINEEMYKGNKVYHVKIPKNSWDFNNQLINSGLLGHYIFQGDNDRGRYGKSNYFIIAKEENPRFDNIHNILKNNFNTSELDKHLFYEDKRIQRKNSTTDRDGKSIYVIKALHPYLQVGLKTDKENFEELQEISRYSFPILAKTLNLEMEDDHIKNVMRYVDAKRDVIEVGSNYEDWYNFISLLKQEGFDVTEVKSAVANLGQKGDIYKMRIDGTFDSLSKPRSDVQYDPRKPIGYQNFELDLNNKIKAGQISKSENDKIKLYPPQIWGAARMFSSSSILLGDEPGVGKTFQLISAMKMRLDESGGNGLIITIKSVQDQFATEIKELLGDDYDDQISTSPTSPAKWTVVRYSDFQLNNEKTREKIKTLMNHNITAVALDEVHNVKSSTNNTGKNIYEITKNVPFVWGASATVASNNADDVHNQLKMINHRLGKLSSEEFKEVFGSNDDPNKSTINAENLNKWLYKSGVYIRRTKKDVREDMPLKNIYDIGIHADNIAIERGVRERVKGYKDSENQFSLLQAARAEIAIAKADMSSNRAADFIRQNEKVLVFSNFKESSASIFQILSRYCEQINEELGTSYYITSYLGSDGDKGRKKNEQTFKNDPNCMGLVISTKIGGTGVDFPNIASNVIMNDYDWTPASATQSEGRTHRISSLNESNVYYMVADNNMDRRLYEKVQFKRRISEIVERSRKNISKAKTPEEIKKTQEMIIQCRLMDKKLSEQLNKENEQFTMNIIGDNEAAKKEFLKQKKKEQNKHNASNDGWEKIG
jgi:hypothetical protein